MAFQQAEIAALARAPWRVKGEALLRAARPLQWTGDGRDLEHDRTHPVQAAAADRRGRALRKDGARAALCKRRAERVLVGADAPPGRPVLDGFSLALIDHLVPMVAAATIAAYAISRFTGADTEAMMLTIPFVVYGLFRHLLLVHRRESGSSPSVSW